MQESLEGFLGITPEAPKQTPRGGLRLATEGRGRVHHAPRHEAVRRKAARKAQRDSRRRNRGR